jgi:hypothetical protein
MERLDYINIIKNFLIEEETRLTSNKNNLEVQLILDETRKHFQLLVLGWEGYERIYNVLFHLDIKDEQVWIQKNSTETVLVEELQKRGVRKDDIVLSLKSSFLRKKLLENKAS